MEYLGSQSCQFQHLIISNFIQLSCALYMSRICCVYTIHVCVDLTKVCFQCCSQCNCRCVRTTSSQCGDILVSVNALETSNDHNALLIQLCFQTLCIDFLDPCILCRRICTDPRLPASKRNHRISQCLNSYSAKSNGDLLSCR